MKSSDSLLEQGRIPFVELATISAREGWRPNATYQAHRWFARRFSSVVRSLLIAAKTPANDDFWTAYRNGVDLRGLTVLDPFVGGGTSIIEAQRLGAHTIGVDVDAVACAITNFESHAHNVAELEPGLQHLHTKVGRKLRRYYVTRNIRGQERDVLHFFWVQRVRCGECGTSVDAHPHYQLAYEAEGHHQWVFCPDCYEIARLPRSTKRHACGCGRTYDIQSGVVKRGALVCPRCSHREPLIDIARRTQSSPRWHLFAMETLPCSHRRRAPLRTRSFQTATDKDRALFRRAHRALKARLRNRKKAFLSARKIPRTGRSDNRILGYGYRSYSDLFNSRQLLHLSLLAEAIAAQPPGTRDALALAFSDHLTTNCMMTHYAFGWRRVAPLFAVRAYRHVPRPVELNPWLDGTGRGTYPNAVRQVARSVTAARVAHASLSSRNGDKYSTTPEVASASILQRDCRDLSVIKNNSVDIVLTDPPYFDNIAYSELSDFFVGWMQLLGLVQGEAAANMGLRHGIAAKARDEGAGNHYAQSLRSCFAEIARVIKPGGPVIFTYQHRSQHAWTSLLSALSRGALRVVQVLPILGNSAAGPHIDIGSCQWDAVFVMRKNEPADSRASGASPESVVARARAHFRKCTTPLRRARSVTFGKSDQISFYRACVVAAGAGMFGARSRATLKATLAELADDCDIISGSKRVRSNP